MDTAPQLRQPPVRGWINANVVFYAIYSLFLLIEVLDFLEMLHSKPPGWSPTYDVVHVTFYMVEMIVCITLTLLFAMFNIARVTGYRLLTSCVLLLIFRGILVYYLYLWTDPEYHWVPFIYKKANEFSSFMRGLFVPLQLLGTIACGWVAWRHRKPVVA